MIERPTFPKGHRPDYSGTWFEPSLIVTFLLVMTAVAFLQIPSHWLPSIGTYTLLGCAWLMILSSFLGTVHRLDIVSLCHVPFHKLNVPLDKIGLSGTFYNCASTSLLSLAFIFSAVPFGIMHPLKWGSHVLPTGGGYYQGLAFICIIVSSLAWWQEKFETHRTNLRLLKTALSLQSCNYRDYAAEYKTAIDSRFNRMFLNLLVLKCAHEWRLAIQRSQPAEAAHVPSLPEVPSQFDPFEL